MTFDVNGVGLRRGPSRYSLDIVRCPEIGYSVEIPCAAPLTTKRLVIEGKIWQLYRTLGVCGQVRHGCSCRIRNQPNIAHVLSAKVDISVKQQHSNKPRLYDLNSPFEQLVISYVVDSRTRA
jgi:hypothetical protein